MPRRARRDEAQSVANDDVSLASAGATSDSASPSGAEAPELTHQATTPDASTDETFKKRPTRTRRTPKPKAAEQLGEITPADAPVSEVSADSPAIKAPRRGGRRKAAGETEGQAVGATDAELPSADSDVQKSRRRRVGGRRDQSVAAGAASDATPSTEGSPDLLIPGLDTDAGAAAQDGQPSTSARRSRRGGRRRREKDRPQSAASVANGETQAVELEAEELLDAGSEGSESEAQTAEGLAKSRRSRRGGRRRSKGQDDATTVNGEVVAAKTVSDRDTPYDLSLPEVRIREHWPAPPLVPTAASIEVPTVALGQSVTIDVARPSIIVNGQAYRPHLFFVNADAAENDSDVVARQTRRAARAGIHLHTCVAYLPLKNAYGERSFMAIDNAIRAIVDADPEALIVLRVQCAPTNFWVRTHPDQMSKFQDGTEGDVSIASTAFWADTVNALGAMIARFGEEGVPGHNRVIALHLDKGEWFYEPGVGYDYSEVNKLAFRNWLHEHYQSEYALKAAWVNGGVTFDKADIPVWESPARDKRFDSVLLDRPKERRIVNYVTFASEAVARVLCGLAHAVKEISAGKLLVLVPYGYVFEFANRNDSGHQALGQVLNCPHIDILTGPNSYASRAAGGVGGFCAPVDSVRLHNKLWIVEDDTKTYLADSETPDSYNPKITGQQETTMVHRRNYFASLIHGCGLSWMDLWGQGWLDSDEIWDEISELLRFENLLQENGAVDAPEAAVMIDEASFSWVRGDASGQAIQSGLIGKARDLLVRSGAAVGFYLQSDVAELPETVKVVFFLNALRVTTAERQAIRDKLQRPGLTLVWLYAPGLYDETGVCPLEVTEIVGMPLKPQAWSSRIGTIFTDERHPVIERLHGGKRMGTDEVVNPSFTVIDPQGTVLGEYAQSGDPSIVARTTESGWKSIFVGEPHLTGELIRGIFRFGGVHLYDVQDDIVYARGDGLLMIHAPYSGQRVVHLPRPAACFSVYENRLIGQNQSSLKVFMRGRSTHLLLWGDLDRIAQQTGRTPDDLLASLNQRPDRDRDRDRDSDEGHGRQSDENDRRDTGDYSLQPIGQDDAQEFAPLLNEIRTPEPPAPSGGIVYFESNVVVTAVGTADASIAAALREASLITEQILSGIAPADEDGDAAEDDEAEEDDPATVVGEGGAQSGAATPSRRSRRRRWRRKEAPGAPKADGGAPVSVDDLLSDLAARKKNQQGPAG